MHFVFTKRKVFNFAVSILKLVACTRIELVSVDYQSTALAIELTGYIWW